MAVSYSDRFAAKLRQTLPEGFTVSSDAYLVTVEHEGGGYLAEPLPTPVNKRMKVHQNDVDAWIVHAAEKERKVLPLYTSEAAENARQMLQILTDAWLIEPPRVSVSGTDPSSI